MKLGEIRQTLLPLALEEGDELETSLNALDKGLFDCSLQLKKLLFTPSPNPDPSMGWSATIEVGVKLPKIDVPTFDGNLLNWQMFWEQFSIAIHKRSSLSDTEKLVYLRHSLKDGTAKKVVVLGGNSAIYMTWHSNTLELSRPCIGIIYHLPAGTEARPEHYVRVAEVPHYKDLLEFINLRAQASESISSVTKKFTRTENRLPRWVPPSKPIASFATSASNTDDNCALCKNEKHPLYACTRFKSLPPDKMTSTLKANELCFNCLRPGHFSKQCPSLNRCRKC